MKSGLLLACLALSANAAPLQEPEPYIVNGTDANIRDFPWMVSIRTLGNHNCGGSILTPRHILTAAHCGVQNVQYGVSHITPTGSNIIGIDYIFRHEGYNATLLVNDISIVLLKSAIPLGPTAQLVKLPKRDFEVPGNWETEATLVGFGRNDTEGVVQEDLQKVRLRVASNAHCQSVHRNPIWETNLCAGVPEGGKGQCSGDSGGPLTLDDGTQVGIVSWSEKPCTVAPFPGVYTKVSKYIDWIEEKMAFTTPPPPPTRPPTTTPIPTTSRFS